MNSIGEDKRREIERVLYEYYGIQNPELQITEEGLQNENYIVFIANGKKFILKKRLKQIYDSKDQVLREINIAAIVYAISRKLKFVIAPRINALGTLVTKDSEGLYLLYNFCEGKHEEYDSPEIIGQIGGAIAQFHNESKLYADRCIVREDKSFFSHIKIMQGNKAFYDEYAKDIIESFYGITLEGTIPDESTISTDTTVAIIHADLTPSNVIFSNGILKGIIDFDNIRVSSREEEVIRFLTSIADRPDLVRAFLTQYQVASTDSINLSEANIRHFVCKDLIEELGIWYEKIATQSFHKEKEFYVKNLSSTIARINYVDSIIASLTDVVTKMKIPERIDRTDG